MIKIPPESYISTVSNPYHAKVEVGKYTSIAEGLRITIASHPSLTHNTVSNFPFYEKCKLDYPKCTVGGRIIIGNDVWIGCNVDLIGELAIGDGAIIGASSVVAKDIPPYSIAVGNPVKIIKHRFTFEQIEKLLKIQWWDWLPGKIRDCITDFKDIDSFIKNMNKQKELWEKLAKENSKYYVASLKGKAITEKQFIISGREDYKKYILFDDLIKTDGICLEIGCGIGRMTGPMASIFNKVIGIDISGEMIRQGKIRLKHLSNIELIETDGEIIPLSDNFINFAFSYIVFQHFKTKEMVFDNFKEVYRVLKPGGMFKVLVRSDKVDLNQWWGGVDCDETVPVSIGFQLLKKEKVKNYGLWLWLQK